MCGRFGQILSSDFRIFDQKYTVEGIESPIRLRIKDVIFVMEVSRRSLKLKQRHLGTVCNSVDSRPVYKTEDAR